MKTEHLSGLTKSSHRLWRWSFDSWWWDFDNDGILDSHEQHPAHLYTKPGMYSVKFIVSNSSQTDTLIRTDYIIVPQFSRITGGPVVNDGGDSQGSSWGDFDSDGDLDLFVANDNEDNFLYANDGSDNFVKIISGPVVNDGGDSRSSSWGDFDNDGDLDLFVTNSDNENNFLYRNESSDSFVNVFSGAVTSDGGNSQSSSWGDFDNDGDLDLFVANLFDPNHDGENFLYRNDLDAGFFKITNGPVVNDRGSSTGSWGDFDNDGDLDLFVANFDENNFLYRNDGNGNFVKITSGPVVNNDGNSFGSSWGDFDNDGDLDLFIANGGFSGIENNFLYRNEGSSNFVKIINGPVVNDGGGSFGSSWGDFDNDGDIDLFVANYRGNNFLYRNNGNINNWINIELIGTASNTSAIGTRVNVRATINGPTQDGIWQMREISGQTGYLSQNSLNADFGLGNATIIDSIKIEWPGGDNEVFTNHAVNKFLRFTENKNFPPSLADSISLVTLTTTDPIFTRDLTTVFTDDPEGDQVIYTSYSQPSNHRQPIRIRNYTDSDNAQ